MWRKTLGLALLAFVLSLTLQGCYSSRRAYGYRDEPGYVSVRVRTSHGYGRFGRGYRYGPSYRVRHYDYDRHDGRHFRKFKQKRHYDEHGRRHR